MHLSSTGELPLQSKAQAPVTVHMVEKQTDTIDRLNNFVVMFVSSLSRLHIGSHVHNLHIA